MNDEPQFRPDVEAEFAVYQRRIEALEAAVRERDPDAKILPENCDCPTCDWSRNVEVERGVSIDEDSPPFM